MTIVSAIEADTMVNAQLSDYASDRAFSLLIIRSAGDCHIVHITSATMFWIEQAPAQF